MIIDDQNSFVPNFQLLVLGNEPEPHDSVSFGGNWSCVSCCGTAMDRIWIGYGKMEMHRNINTRR